MHFVVIVHKVKNRKTKEISSSIVMQNKKRAKDNAIINKWSFHNIT